MKIEVGKTYKNGLGQEILIEVKLTQPVLDAYPYIGTKPYDADGSHMMVYAEDGTTNTMNKLYNLLPNKVKKEGWINIYRNTSGAAACTGSLWPTREGAEIAAGVIPTIACVKIEWEEEE